MIDKVNSVIQKCFYKIKIRKRRPTPVFSEVFSDFISHRCTIKPTYTLIYAQFIREFLCFSKEKHSISKMYIKPEVLNVFLENNYPGVHIIEDFIFGIRIWY